jgi:catechol 1,2-dioxygenase
MQKADIENIATRLAATSSKAANPRAKTIIDRLVFDLMLIIDEFNIQPEEFWAALAQLTAFGTANEFGLLAAGLGLEHYFDLRIDEQEAQAGIEANATPRTIEGPLYISGAPVSEGEARLDDGSDPAEILFMDGQIKDASGIPIAGAFVEVWHCNSKGNYSFFDKAQPTFNLRGSIIADSNGRYRFQSIMPAGYGVPLHGETEKILDLLGRHGRRPAHIHFMISAPGYRQLTTQINIKGDQYTYDDFAFATREELIPDINHHSHPEELQQRGVDRPFATITFDFTLPHVVEGIRSHLVNRPRAA